MQEEVKEDTKEEAQEVKDTQEEVKEGTNQEGTKVTKEAGARTTKEDGTQEGKVTKDIKEEVKEGTEERKAIREEVKEGTKGGTRQRVTKDSKEEGKEVNPLSRSASATATNAAVEGISPKTARQALTRSTKAQGGQQE